MECSICRQNKDDDNTIKHLDLYTVGSEGTNVCFTCEMLIVEFIRGLKSVAGSSFLRGFKTARHNSIAKEKIT